MVSATRLLCLVVIPLALAPDLGAQPYLVKDINQVNGSNPSGFVGFNGQTFFTATDGAGPQLWKTDGTAPGTARVANVLATELTPMGGMLLFAGSDGVNGTELWRTDGTEIGTAMIVDINPSGSADVRDLTVLNGLLYFSADDGGSGRELWRSDGTLGGTSPVADVWPQGDASVSELTLVNGTLFFVADDGVHGRELWKSDGTLAGTALVKDVNPGAASADPAKLSAALGRLYFAADDGWNGREPWTSDGTADQTKLIRDISGSGGSDPHAFTELGNAVFFFGSMFPGYQLWRSDGTEAGTTMLTNFGPGVSAETQLTPAGNALFFPADDGVHGQELWKTDGTSAGTMIVRDIVELGSSSQPRLLTSVYDTLFFTATVGDTGTELWTSDGTADATVLAEDIAPGPLSSQPQEIAVVGGHVFFAADDTITGNELWAVRVNQPPVANAGHDQTVDFGTPVVLDGGSSFDPDGGPLSFEWMNEADVVISDIVFAYLNPLPSGTHTFVLRVSDGQLSATDSVTVTVLPDPNRAPVANAGPDQTVPFNSSPIYLDGTASFDPDGDQLTFEWRNEDNGVVFFGAIMDASTFPLAAGDHVFTLTVRDWGLSSTDTVTITVLPQPQLSISDVSILEGSIGGHTPRMPLPFTSMMFTVSLSSANSAAVSVDYSTANGTATMPSDYAEKRGTLVLPAGTTTATLNVTIRSDRRCEANEFFFVNLSSPSGTTIGDGQGVGTILDDDCH